MFEFIGLIDTERGCTLNFTITHTHTPYLQSRLHKPLLGSFFERRRFPSSASRTIPGLSSSRLTNSVTHQPTPSFLSPQLTVCPAINVSGRTAHKTPFPFAIYGSLPSNGPWVVSPSLPTNRATYQNVLNPSLNITLIYIRHLMTIIFRNRNA
jgi:hypothetical protein